MGGLFGGKFVRLEDVIKYMSTQNIPNSPALIEVSDHSDYLNAVGDLCNKVKYGHAGIRKVSTVSWRRAEEGSKEVSDVADIKIERYSDGANNRLLRVGVYLHGINERVLESIKHRIAEYIFEKTQQGTLSMMYGSEDAVKEEDFDIPVDSERARDSDKILIKDNLGTEPWHEERLIANLNQEECAERGYSVILEAKTHSAGYLIRDILKCMNVEVKPTDHVDVSQDKITWMDKAKDFAVYPLFLLLAPAIYFMDRGNE